MIGDVTGKGMGAAIYMTLVKGMLTSLVARREGTGSMLVDLNDHETMAQHAIRLLEDPDLVEQMTKAAYAELEQYAWRNIRREWLAVYHELAGG